jgi:hypothetical protein
MAGRGGGGAGRGGAGLGRGLASLLNFCLYLVAACLAGWALNWIFDHGIGGVGMCILPALLDCSFLRNSACEL